jgi:hypothetical protein
MWPTHCHRLSVPLQLHICDGCQVQCKQHDILNSEETVKKEKVLSMLRIMSIPPASVTLHTPPSSPAIPQLTQLVKLVLLHICP